MHILHVLSQFQVTGAEVYAATLATHQVDQGHEVKILSDTWHTPTKATVLAHPIGIRTWLQRWKNVFFIRQFIKANGIDVVHAHSRAASWVCYFALRGSKTPLVSHIHGRQHIHRSSKSFDMYGDRILVVCDNLKTHLVQELGIKKEKIFVSPNGFEWRKIIHAKTPEDYIPYNGQTIIIAGRTTSHKGEHTGQLILEVIPAVLQLIHKHWRLIVIGGPITDMIPEVQRDWEILNTKYPDRFIWVGFTPQLSGWMLESDIVIGSGRVAIEAISMGKEVIAMGEWCTHGHVTDKNIDLAVASNFGDIGARMPHPGVDWEWVKYDLVKLLLTKQTSGISDFLIDKVKEQYDIEKIAADVVNHYHSAWAKTQHAEHIPILMYHKVPLEPIESVHRIFVTKDTFHNHLELIKKNKLTPINFGQYHAWKMGKLPKDWMPKKPIILTFDDAYLDNYTNAWPLLKEFGYTAVIYALGDADLNYNRWDVEKGEKSEPLMSLAQKREMVDAGIEFGAHSMSHPDLTLLNAKQLKYELEESKARLEQDLGINQILSIAYPYGITNEKVIAATKAAGYLYGVVINQNAGDFIEDDQFRIFRAYIFPEDNNNRFLKKASSWYRAYFKWKRKA